jgi:hypothetical protein
MLPVFDSASSPAPTFHGVLKALETDSAVCYVLDSQLDIAYANPAWDQFAKDNDGSDLTADAVHGTNIFQVIPRILRRFYTRVFDEVRNKAMLWEHIYECSGPQRFRKFRMRVHLLNPDWLMVSNTLLIEEDLGWKSSAHDFVYRNRRGLIVMCANCRSSQRTDDPRSVGFLLCPRESPSSFSRRPCWPLPDLSRLFLSTDLVPENAGLMQKRR